MVPAIVKTDAVVVNIRRINDYARFYRATHCILSVRTFVRLSVHHRLSVTLVYCVARSLCNSRVSHYLLPLIMRASYTDKTKLKIEI